MPELSASLIQPAFSGLRLSFISPMKGRLASGVYSGAKRRPEYNVAIPPQTLGGPSCGQSSVTHAATKAAEEGLIVAFYDPQERHIADLHEAFRSESIDRRTFLKVAGAAALATGLSHNAVVPSLAAPSRVRAIRAQPDASRQADPAHFGRDRFDLELRWVFRDHCVEGLS